MCIYELDLEKFLPPLCYTLHKQRNGSLIKFADLLGFQANVWFADDYHGSFDFIVFSGLRHEVSSICALPITEGYNTLVDMFLNEDRIYQLLDENQEGI